MHGESRPSRLAIQTGIRWAMVACLLLLGAGVATAQGTITPSFGNGELVVIAEGYQPGEHVELNVRVGGTAYRFTVTADAHGDFCLATGLAVVPLSSIEIEARDEQGQTQATMMTGDGGLPAPPTGSDGLIEGEQTVDPSTGSCVP
ncbi:MAG TPA: hypothetical protein VFH48_11620 [Chloroflexota bacterium]|nr:hypothetical protein [Chloroflexota bacterium]